MNKKLIVYIGIGFSLFLIAIYFLVQVPTRETNWKDDYSTRSKNPFSFYILKRELKTILETETVLDLDDIYDLDTISNPSEYAIIYLNRVQFKKNDFPKQLTDFLEEGGDLFISYGDASFISTFIEDTIHQNLTYKPQSFNSFYNRYTDDIIGVPKRNLSTEKILGRVKCGSIDMANFYKEQYKHGNIYVHVHPKLFTNFYLLQKDGYHYTKDVFSVINGKKIIWVDPFTKLKYNQKANNNSSIRFILSQPELRIAWELLMGCLMLYLLFQSKRRQRIIPIVETEKNLSLEYAHVIASMYYESGKPHDIIQKKVDYFYHTIRKRFNLTTDNPNDEHFIYVLAQKAQISEDELKNILNEINQIYHNKNARLNDVNRIYTLIENYKKHANL